MKRINEIYVFAMIEEATDIEGVPAITVGKMVMPLIAADPERIEALKQIARGIERDKGVKPKLLKFSVREEVEWE